MDKFLHSWTGIIVGVIGSALIDRYFGFLVWLLSLVIFVLVVAVLKHSENTQPR